jgi:hypothetical protein
LALGLVGIQTVGIGPDIVKLAFNRIKQDVAFYHYARSATSLKKKEMMPVAPATHSSIPFFIFQHFSFD